MAKRKQKKTVVSKLLQRLYYTPKFPSSFGGKAPLKSAVKKELKKKKIKRSNKNLDNSITSWLEDQKTYTLHKQPKRSFQRRQIIVGGINDQWQADLADMQLLASDNLGMKYILMVIDCFSRKAWARALKDKSGKSVASAFSDIFKVQEPPRKIQTDKGKEFYNVHVQTLLKNKGVHLFSTEDPNTKAAMVERLNRTIKNKLYSYLYAKNTNKWIDVLQDIIDSYNNKKHSVIKMAPSEVTNENAHIVSMNNRHNRGKGRTLSTGSKKTFKSGDLVRIVSEGNVFKKKYLPQWTEEIFRVRGRLGTAPAVYRIEDLSGEIIKGTFYAEELQKVTSLPTVHEIEKVLEEKGNKLLVKWRGYPDSMNQWIHKSSLKKI